MPTQLLSSRIVRSVRSDDMLVKLEEVATIPFSTRDPATGGAAAPTAGPTVTVYEEGALTPMVGTDVALVTLTATGQYAATVTCTAASGFEVGKTYIVRAAATFSAVSDEAPVGSFQCSVENHGLVIDKAISSTVTDLTAYGDANWTNVTAVSGSAQAADNIESVFTGTGHTDDVDLSARSLKLESDQLTPYAFEINSTYSGAGNTRAFSITNADGAAIYAVGTTYGIYAEGPSGDIFADIEGTVNSVVDPASIWAHTDTESATKSAFQVICMAAAGAGAGTVDTTVPAGVTRNETTRYLDGSDAYITAADENGNRTLVNLNP